MTEEAHRQSIVDACRSLVASGLIQGTSGNVSIRHGAQMLITPSGIPYADMTPEMIAAMPLDGAGDWSGPLKPSSEWRFHLDILNARPDAGAIVHAHPTFCTALAMARRPMPAAHYMIAAFGGRDVRCAGYATFGTQALSDLVLEAIHDRQACLMANHGMIALGADLPQTLWRAEELETLARQYVASLTIGGPVLLSDAEMAEAQAQFKGYGLQPKD